MAMQVVRRSLQDRWVTDERRIPMRTPVALMFGVFVLAAGAESAYAQDWYYDRHPVPAPGYGGPHRVPPAPVYDGRGGYVPPPAPVGRYRGTPPAYGGERYWGPQGGSSEGYAPAPPYRGRPEEGYGEPRRQWHGNPDVGTYQPPQGNPGGTRRQWPGNPDVGTYQPPQG